MEKNSRIETEIVERDNGKFLAVQLGGKDYELPFKLIAGRLVGFLDISGQVSLIESAAQELVDRLLAAGVEFDTILNPVSKSNALAHAIALKWAAAKGTDIPRTVVARKSSSPAKVQANYRSVTTPTEQTLSLTDDDVEFIRGKRILLVDDITTSGATLSECAQVLKCAGASEITCVTLAQKRSK